MGVQVPLSAHLCTWYSGVICMQRFYVVREVFNNKLERGYEFSVGNEYLEQKVNERLREAASGAVVAGFRKGKVSPELIRRMHGEGIAKEVVSRIIDSASSEFLDENGYSTNLVTSEVKVISYPKVCAEDGKGGDNLVYELRLEVMPEVPAINLDEIALEEVEVQVSEGDLEEFLDDLESNCREFKVASSRHGVAVGDKVTIDYKVSSGGKVIKGGSANGAVFTIGKGALLQSFEKQISGMKSGESRDFKMQFPDDYPVKHLAGKDVDVSVQLHKLEVKKKEKMDREALAAKCTFGSVDDLVKFATDKLNEKFADMCIAVMQRELFKCMDEKYSFDVPEYIVSQEMGRMVKEARGGSKVSYEGRSVRQEAERRVKLGMILMKVAEDEGVNIEPQDILSFIRANYLGYGQSVEAVLKLLRSRSDFRDHVRGKVLEDKVVRHIISKAKKEKRVMSVKELEDLLSSDG